MSDERKDLPPANSPQFLERVREALSTYLGNRGNKLDRGVTLRDLADSGVIDVSPRYLAGGRGNPIGGAGSAVVDAYELDLTPPPTPTGFTASAGLNHVFITCATQAYTAGHGHAKSILYGKERAAGDPVPLFGAARVLREFTGTVDAFPSNLGVTWHLWLKWVSVDGEASVTPAGGTNGEVATTGKIGNADLNALIIEAGNLANGSVSASKLAALAVDATKFANGIEPISVVTGILPVAKSTNTIFRTDDQKLYRWDGSAYIATVPAADLSGQVVSTQITDDSITTAKIAAGAVTATEIAANAITAGKIQAGAIGAAEIAAGAITTNKLLVTGRGAALNDDPYTTDLTAWSFVGAALVTDTTCPVGTSVIETAANTWGVSRRMTLDAARNYQYRFWLKGQVGTCITYGMVQFFDANNNVVYTTGTWPGEGSYSYFGIVGGAAPAGWTEYVASFGPNETMKIPAGAKTFAIGAILNYNGSSGGATSRVAGLRVFEKAAADMIVDGSISATKLSAGAIAVGTAAIQDGAIVNSMIGNATIDNAKIANLNASKITAGNLQVGSYLRSTSYVPGSSGWTINADGTAELANATVRGSIYATAGYLQGVEVRNSAGTVLLNAGDTAGDVRNSYVNLNGLGMRSFRVAAWGNSAVGAPIGAGLYDGQTNVVILSGGTMYRAAKINRATGAVTDVGSWHTLAGAPNPANMAAALNAIGNDHIVVVFTYDEPQGNRLTAGLDAAMYRCGASRSIFGSPNFQYRSAYVLIGIPGCGEGNGAEFYQGAINSDPNGWVDVAFSVVGGNIVGVTGNYTPRTLTDYGFTGDLNATANQSDATTNNAIAAKLNNSGANVMASGFFLQTNGYAGGNGVALYDGGLIARQGEVNKFVIGSDGSATFSGALSAATGSFAGSLSAATGTFAGSLSAATGSFAGSLSAATGSFAGSLSAATGTFSGSLTASAVNAVNTINLAGQAVTIPASIYSAGSVTISSGASVAVQQVYINSSGAPILVMASAMYSAVVFTKIYRDAVLIYDSEVAGFSSMQTSVQMSDTPGAGEHTYYLYAKSTGDTISARFRSLCLLETKK